MATEDPQEFWMKDEIKKDLTGLNQSQYDFSYKYFPNDLTSNYNGHYMVININVPIRMDTRAPRTAFQGSQFMTTVLNNEYSKVDLLRFGNAEPIAGAPNQASELYTMPRYTKRIAESIALFMPNGGIVNSHQNIYEEVSLTPLAGKAFSVAVGAGVGAVAGARGYSHRKAMRGIGGAAALGDAFGRMVSKASSILHYPINPRVEVLFANTPQKQYVFEVLMAPTNQKESESIEQIIKTLRFHAAPELSSFEVAGYGIVPTLIPPAEFDITFFNKGVENTHIPRINTCVLERIEADYAPAGGVYSTFSNGHPVAVRLSMAFREVEISHKQRILQKF